MSCGLLLDEHVPRAVQISILRQDPEVVVYRIRDGLAPPLTTSDPEILDWIEEHDCLLVTNNRATMPIHLAAHLAKSRHVPGIVQLPRRLHMPSVIGDLWLVVRASLPGELGDQIVYLPL